MATSRFVSDHLELAADHLLLAMGCVREAIDPVYVTETPTPKPIGRRRDFDRQWTRYLVQASRQFGNLNGQEW
jgi:hypothetical protein